MASIRKRGKTYQIRVSVGYNVNGEQITKTTNFTPPPNMTEKQAEKEVQKIAFEFEQRCKNGLFLDGSIKLAEFTEKWFKDYAEKELKTETIYSYKCIVKNVYTALGHIKLSKLQPMHLIEFYNNLAEEGIREDLKYRASKDLKQILKFKSLTQSKLASLTGLSEGTIKQAVNNRNITKATADKISSALEADNLFKIAEGQRTKLAPSTILRYHHFISSVLTTAVYWQIIPYNPCDRVKPPKVPKKEQSYLDDTQTIEFIKKLREAPLKYRALVSLYIDSGARRGEITGLEWSDFNPDACLINISKESLYVPGHGIFDDTPKNKGSERLIKISPVTAKLLLQWRKEQAKLRLMMGDQWQGSRKIFTSHSGGPMHPDTVTSWITDFANEHGFKNIHTHSLRHTNATLLIANGTDIRTVAERLGHTKASTTTDIYSHALKKASDAASDKLTALLYNQSDIAN